jgi:hypothetical protein
MKSHSTQPKKPFQFNSYEKPKKPSQFNSYEKAVLIQLSQKARSYSTRSKKPFQFSAYEKAVLIELSRKAVLIQLS